ncbi:MAG: DUF11 domain-containing protein [Clostridia bacterium]|nr:DUF11 domain-containing protein [Clostridia bacterium]
MTKRFKKFLVMAIVFAITFVNYGLPLQAIATEGTGFLFGANFFRKDEIELKAYFDEDAAQKTKVLNVNDTARLTVEVTPLIEGYLKSGSLKFNFSNGNENNFRIQGITVESEEKEQAPELDSAEKVEMVQDVEEILPTEPVVPEKTTEEEQAEGLSGRSFLTEGTKSTLQNVKGGLGDLLQGSTVEDILQEEPAIDNTAEENIVTDNAVTETPEPEAEEIEKPVEEKPETEKEENVEQVEDVTDEPETGNGLSDLLVSEETEDVETTLIEEILVVNENEIELNNVIENTKIYVDIVYKQGEAIKVEDLYNNINIKLEGNYINKNLDVLEIAYEDEVTLGWEYSKEVDVISNYVKVSPFTVGENVGTIVTNEVIVRRAITTPNYLPIKETNIKLIIPKINDKLPTAVNVRAENLMATCGQELNEVVFTNDNWSYDEATGEMQITVRNENAMVSQGDDKFTVVCRYEDYINTETIELEKDVVVKVEEYNSNSNKVYEKTLKETQEKAIDAGELITYTASATEEKINKGRINANYNAEVQYETEFSTILNVNLLTSDLLEEIRIEGFEDVYVDAENNEFDASSDIMYKKVKLYYSEIKEMLEKGTTIDLLDENDNVLHTLTKENTTNQDGCDLEITQRVKQAKIRVNNIQTNGNITIEFVKVIAKSNYSLVEFNNFEKIVSKAKASVKYVDMEERFSLKEVQTEKLFSESKTEASLHINKEYLSTVKDNYNVELKIELNNHLETSDLYKNPVFEIVFPGYIKEVEIQNMNLFHEDGLRVSDFKTFTQNGEVRLKLELEGVQKSFCESNLTNGSNIIINANIKVDEATPRKHDEIRLFYFNEAATNYQAETEWNIDKLIPGNIVSPTNGYDAVVIEYQAPVGLIAINSIENYDGLSSVLKSVKQGEVKDMLSVGQPAQKAKIRISTLNNTGNDCTDMVIVGRIPFEGNKHIETGKDLGSTLTIPMISLIEEDPENKIKAKIYYSTNENATRDLKDGSNGWVETVEDISKIRSYLIVPEGTFNAGEILSYSYNVEIPANLPYEGKIYGTFTAYYNNHTEYAIVYEATTADKVGLETEPGPRIEASMSVDIGDGAEIKEGKLLNYTVKVKNTGSVTAEGVDVVAKKPNNTEFVELKASDTHKDANTAGYYVVGNDEHSIKIDSLEPGEEQEIKFIAKTKDMGDKEKANPIVEAKATVKVNNFAIETETNSVKNKLVDSNIITDVSAEYFGKLEDNSSIRYLFKATNVSEKDLTNVIIEVKLPKELHYKDSSIVVDGINEEIVPVYNEEEHEVKVEVDTLYNLSGFKLYVDATVSSGAEEPVAPVFTINADGIEEEKGLELYTKLYGGIVEASLEKLNIDSVRERESVQFVINLINKGERPASLIKIETIPSEYLTDVKVRYEGASTGSGILEGDRIVTNVYGLANNGSVKVILEGKAKDLAEENKEQIIESIMIVKHGEKEIATLKSEAVTIVENPDIVEDAIENPTEEPTPPVEDNQGKLIEKPETSDKEDVKQDNMTVEKEEPEKVENKVQNQEQPKEEKQEVQDEVKQEEPEEEKQEVKQEQPEEEKQEVQEPIEVEKYSISGRVWVDTDEDGQRDDDEELLKDIEVQLYRGTELVTLTTTNSIGFYNFSEVEKGEYTVVIKYDGEMYTSTTYNQAKVNSALSSKAIEVETGKATSNELTVENANIEYINLGLAIKQKFNLAINKYVTKAVINIDDKKEEYDFEDLELAKIEIAAKKLNKAVVDLSYKIVVENIGNVEGYAAMINDILPVGMTFDEERNEGWYLGEDGKLYNETLKDKVIKPGEKVELEIVLTKYMNEENTGAVSNKALIAEAINEKELKENIEMNSDTQVVLILVKTGYTPHIITAIVITTSIIIIATNKKIYIKSKDKDSKMKFKKIFKRIYK